MLLPFIQSSHSGGGLAAVKKVASYDSLPLISEIAAAAFELSEDKPLPAAPLKSEKGAYVIRYKDRKLPDDAGFKQEKTTIEASLLGQKKRDLFSALVANLRANSDIVIEDRYQKQP